MALFAPIMTPVPTSKTWMMCGGWRARKAAMAGVQGFRIRPLVDGNDLVVALGGVEFLREVLDRLVVGAGHRVPPLDLGLGLGRNRRGARHGDKGERRCGERRVNAVHLSRLPDLRIVVMVSDPQ
jgi:hypothetical protein